MTDIAYESRPAERQNYANWVVRNEAIKAWQEAQRPTIRNQVHYLNNEQLLEEFYFWGGGDDYDGCTTEGGEVVAEEVRAELRNRLIACDFLKESNE